MKPTITIIGAGLTGCFLAILLAKKGYQVDIYEKLSQTKSSRDSTKSFSLTFYAYGVKTLKQAELWDNIEPFVVPLKGSVTHLSSNKKPIISGFGIPYYSIARSHLLQSLFEKAKQNPLISLHFGNSLIGVNRQDKTITIQNVKSQKCKTIPAEIVIGADGINSQVRAFIQIGQHSTHSQEIADWEYKQINLTKEIVKTLNSQNNFMYAWTRKNAIFTAFPNLNGSCSAMLILPKDQKKGFHSLKTQSEVENFINKQFPELLPALPEITKSLLTNPTGYFSTLKTSPWYYQDWMIIIGDAAHGFPPFYGQGISTCFTDVQKFIELLDKHKANWAKILPEYQEERKKHTDVLANLSNQIFVRYTRQTRADYSAIYERLEAILHTISKKIFMPPIFNSIAQDPTQAANYIEKQKKQRKIARLLGIPIIVAATTALIMLHGKIQYKNTL